MGSAGGHWVGVFCSGSGECTVKQLACLALVSAPALFAMRSLPSSQVLLPQDSWVYILVPFFLYQLPRVQAFLLATENR